MLNFVLCDDSHTAIEKLSIMLDSIFIKNNLDGQIVFSTPNPYNLLKYVETHSVNVVILDVDLNTDINGLKLAEKIRTQNKSIYIIFITGHLEYGLIAYKYKTFDYMMMHLITLMNTYDLIIIKQ